MRSDRLELSRDTPELVLDKYESFRSEYKPPGESDDTETHCRNQGLRFAPMVIEAHGGGWSKTARVVLDNIAKNISTTCRENHEIASLAIAQRISTTLHREDARAIVRRRCEAAPPQLFDAAPAEEPGYW
eukprot:TRINITY_DN5385_c0_g1_i2.p5 TRINITY_DN5385_c0_g1~~TRINITY_DN5385_c0_g1_i2.p5  ORF type:complete len:130 (+),score=27.49 TRINITY_DN5385_c0_g1_i2:2170-2559(+)